MTRTPITTLVLVFSLMGCGNVPTSNGKNPVATPTPTLEEVKSTVLRLDGVIGWSASVNRTQDHAKAAEIVGTPFAYAGFAYDLKTPADAQVCVTRWGEAGIAKATDVAAFLDCVAIAGWGAALDGESDWARIDPAKIPDPIRHLTASIRELAQRHIIVMSHFRPAGPAEYWNVYAARYDDAHRVRIDALLVSNQTEGGE